MTSCSFRDAINDLGNGLPRSAQTLTLLLGGELLLLLAIDNGASATTWMSRECKHSDVSVARLAWQETLS